MAHGHSDATSTSSATSKLRLVVNNDAAGMTFADWLIDQYHKQYVPGQFDPAVNVHINDGYPAEFVIDDAMMILALRGWQAEPTAYRSAGCRAGNVRMRPPTR